jgi:hypothetical protein
MKHVLYISLFLAVAFSSCTKETPSTYNANLKGRLSVEFDNIVGSSDLQLNTGSYINSTGEHFSVSLLKYFVSNFKLVKSDGSVYTVPQDSCYFLIDESNPATHQPVLWVPEGEYTNLQFTVGIDSIRNTMDISNRTGVLDPTGNAAGMYWSWNSGYIFFKMEGVSPASTQNGNIFQYHIGLFGGYNTPTLNNIKNISLDLTARGVPQVKNTKSTNIHLTVDVLKMFSGTTPISIAANSVIMANPISANVANNYTAMFSHDHTEN